MLNGVFSNPIVTLSKFSILTIVLSSFHFPQTHRDVSVALKSSESGIIDGVMLTTNENGSRFVKV